MIRLDVNDQVGNPIELLAGKEPHACRKLVRILNRHEGIDLKMKFSVVLEACFRRVNVLDARHARPTYRHLPDVLDPLLIRHGVHQLVTRVAHNVNGCKQNDQTDSESAPVIGRGKNAEGRRASDQARRVQLGLRLFLCRRAKRRPPVRRFRCGDHI